MSTPSKQAIPNHPGAKEILAPLKLVLTKAAKALGLRRATLSDYGANSPGSQGVRIEVVCSKREFCFQLALKREALKPQLPPLNFR
jgi:hypothetical protein